ncbi:MAG: hypothetical protein RR358_03535 [Cetobacterium sp.]
MESYEEGEIGLYEIAKIILKQKIIVIAVMLLSFLVSLFFSIRENKNFDAKKIMRSIEISKQESKFEEVKANLINVETKIKNIVDEESKSFKTAVGISDFINLKYSTILREKKELNNEYEKEKEKLKKLNNPIKNKAKLIFGTGISLGIILGIFVAFFKEFIDRYKDNKKLMKGN